jgi:hypothetical protein
VGPSPGGGEWLVGGLVGGLVVCLFICLFVCLFVCLFGAVREVMHFGRSVVSDLGYVWRGRKEGDERGVGPERGHVGAERVSGRRWVGRTEL